MLKKDYGTKVILLIDEYDAPLAKAHANGYYDQMLPLIRSLLGAALKTNSSLKFAVLTGCLRISKESIFTGQDDLKVRSITDVRFDRYFGFTDTEIKALLKYYGYPDSYDAAKKWYDGYRFGNVDVYCPWDVLNYCDSLLDDREAQPENYWINTSSNDAVKRFIQRSANTTTKREIERLIAGEIITKEIHQELTYPEIYQTIDNIWSLLFTTGYLTQRREIGTYPPLYRRRSHGSRQQPLSYLRVCRAYGKERCNILDRSRKTAIVVWIRVDHLSQMILGIL